MRLSNRLVSAAFIAAMVFPATSSAVVITIGSGSWTLGDGWANACTTSTCDITNTYVNATWDTDTGLAQFFNLYVVGDSVTVTFGTATLAEENGFFDSPPPSSSGNETNGLGITANLFLTAPTATNAGAAGTVLIVAGSLNDVANDLSVTFAPVTVGFGDGGQFTVDLSDPVWNCNPGTADCSYSSPSIRTINATFTLTRAPEGPPNPPAGVPEPGVLLLMGAGLMGLGLARRRKPV